MQLDENGDVVATIEGHLSHHDLQQAEAEAIDDENAAILHDDQQPLTSSFTGHHTHMPPTTSMSSFGGGGGGHTNVDAPDR